MVLHPLRTADHVRSSLSIALVLTLLAPAPAALAQDAPAAPATVRILVHRPK